MEPISQQTKITALLQEVESLNESQRNTDVTIKELSKRIFPLLKEVGSQYEQDALEHIVKIINDPKLTKRFYEEQFCNKINSTREVFFPYERQSEKIEEIFPIYINFDSLKGIYTAHYINCLNETNENFHVMDLDEAQIMKKVQEIKNRLQEEAIKKVEDIAGKENVRGPLEISSANNWNTLHDLYSPSEVKTPPGYIVTYPTTAYAGELVLVHHQSKGVLKSFPAPLIALDYAISLVKLETN